MELLLNPSTADATTNDWTITRCIGFASDWQYSRMVVANLFACIATKPRDLRQEAGPVGTRNDFWLNRLAAEAHLVVAGWGNNGLLHDRAAIVGDRLPRLHCLGITKRGTP